MNFKQIIVIIFSSLSTFLYACTGVMIKLNDKTILTATKIIYLGANSSEKATSVETIKYYNPQNPSPILATNLNGDLTHTIVIANAGKVDEMESTTYAITNALTKGVSKFTIQRDINSKSQGDIINFESTDLDGKILGCN